MCAPDLHLDKHGANIIESFHSDVIEAARAVRRESGASLLVTQNEYIFDLEPKADITKRVVERLQSASNASAE